MPVVQSQPVEFLEQVEFDLIYATEFYDSWLTNGAERFLGRFRATVNRIAENPELFPRKHRFFRRAIISRTYFGIYFAIEPGVSTVVAVLDLRNDSRGIRSAWGCALFTADLPRAEVRITSRPCPALPRWSVCSPLHCWPRPAGPIPLARPSRT